LPVILFSAEDDLKEISEQCGADGYVSKPFTAPQLTAKINELFAA